MLKKVTALTLLLILPSLSFGQEKKADKALKRVVFSEMTKNGIVHHSIDIETGEDSPLKFEGATKEEFIWSGSADGRYLTLPFSEDGQKGGSALYDLVTLKRTVLVKPSKKVKFTAAHVIDKETAIIIYLNNKRPKTTAMATIKLDGTGKKHLYHGEMNYDWDDYPFNKSADGTFLSFRARKYANEKRIDYAVLFNTKKKRIFKLDGNRYSHIVPNPDNKTFAWRFDNDLTDMGKIGKLVDGVLKEESSLGENVWVQRWLDKEHAFIIHRKKDPKINKTVNFGEILNIKTGTRVPFGRDLRYDDGITHFSDFNAKTGRLVWLETQRRPNREYKIFTAVFKEGKITDKRKLYTAKKYSLPPKLTIDHTKKSSPKK